MAYREHMYFDIESNVQYKKKLIHLRSVAKQLWASIKCTTYGKKAHAYFK